MITLVKNQTSEIISLNDLSGIEIPANGSIDLINDSKLTQVDIAQSNHLLELISNESVIINNGTVDLDKVSAIRYIALFNEEIIRYPKDQRTLVKVTQRPVPTDKRQFYTVWTSNGDNVANESRHGGQPILLQTQMGIEETYINLEFLTGSEKVYIHQGFLGWENAGWGDHISFDVRAKATPIIADPNGTYIIENHKIIYSPTGTHSLTGQPVFVKNPNKRGWWDYIDGQVLFNAAQNGIYDWYDEEKLVFRFLNFLVYGTSHTPILVESNDVEEIPPNYYIRVIAHNISNTEWKSWGAILIYRELTFP